jgi:hypothetical protein
MIFNWKESASCAPENLTGKEELFTNGVMTVYAVIF